MADDNAISLDDWQHIAVTLDAETLTFYVEGLVVGTSTGVPTPLASSSPVRIGLRATDNNWAFQGGIDDLSIWKTALSQAQIQSLMGVELTGSESGLVAYLPMNEGSGQSTEDITANTHDGILGSTNTPESNDPTWVTP